MWNLARIPTCRKDHAIVKLEQLHKEWSTLKKHKSRTSELHKSNEMAFCCKMNDLFDIAHANVATMVTIAEDLEFLAAQREPGRRGYMGAVDTVLAAKEERKAKRMQLEKARKQCALIQANEINSLLLEDGSSSSSNEEEHNSDSDQTVGNSSSDYHTPSRKRKRASKKVITPKLAAALDSSKLSDRKATFVIAETAMSLGHDPSDICINRSSIKRGRERYRAEIAAA